MYKYYEPVGTLKSKLERIRLDLWSTLDNFVPHWQEIADYVRPRRPRFLVTDVNQGDKRTSKIINSSATLASNVLASGMVSGITSPSRKWMGLTTPYAQLNNLPNVKAWLYDTNEKMLAQLGQTEFYQVIQTFYQDLGDFGTAAMLAEKDTRNVATYQSLPIGSYAFARDSKGLIVTVVRKFMLSARQITEKFGEHEANGEPSDWSIFSRSLQSAMKTGGHGLGFEVCHIILPNDQYVEGALGPKGKKFLSVYYEMGTGSRELPFTDELYSKYLNISGYDEMPVFIGVWSRTGEDDYGTSCPGMDTLGDVKQLQTMERRGAKALEKQIDPPMQGPSGIQKQQVNLLPGALSVVDSSNGRQALTPLHEVRVDFADLREDKQWIISRIDEHYFKKMFLLQIESQREMTAREVDERSQEKLLVIGPVLEQLNKGVLSPNADWLFKQMWAAKRLLPPPPELRGVDLIVEYQSINTQAQKALGLAGIDRLASSVVAYAAVDPSIVDAIDSTELVKSWGDFTSSPPGVVRSTEQIKAIRDQRAQQQQQQANAEAAANQATAAQKLSQSDTTGKNALTDLIKQANAGAVQ